MRRSRPMARSSGAITSTPERHHHCGVQWQYCQPRSPCWGSPPKDDQIDLDAGINWQASPNFALFAGYRGDVPEGSQQPWLLGGSKLLVRGAAGSASASATSAAAAAASGNADVPGRISDRRLGDLPAAASAAPAAATGAGTRLLSASELRTGGGPETVRLFSIRRGSEKAARGVALALSRRSSRHGRNQSRRHCPQPRFAAAQSGRVRR